MLAKSAQLILHSLQMLLIDELLAVERDIAINSAAAETGAHLVELCTKSVALRGNGFGLTASFRFQGELLTATCGKWGDIAQALSKTGLAQPGFIPVRIPLGDASKTLGNLDLVFPGETNLCSASHESLSRIGVLLSSNLRRIDAEQRLLQEISERESARRLMRHRMRNSLQFFQNMLYLILRTGEERKAPVSSSDIEEWIAALILFHEELGSAANGERLLVGTWLRLLSGQLRNIFGDLGTAIIPNYATEKDPLIPVDQGTAIGLIVYELIIRSLATTEYRPISIRIGVSTDEGKLDLFYADGMTPIEEEGELPAFLMKSLLTRTGGSLSIAPESGRIKLQFPLDY